MLSMPSLIIPSLVASVLLALFLAFWISVVVCLATANHPGQNPLLEQTPINETELNAVPRLKLFNKNNTGADYKSFIHIEYSDADWLKNMLWFYFIGLIWTCEFIFGEYAGFIHCLSVQWSYHSVVLCRSLSIF